MIIKELLKIINRYRTDHFIAARNILNDKHNLITKHQKKRWYNERHYISKAINIPGSIIDPSCGTGALLFSLSDWSGYDLITYGCDIDPFAIEQSNLIFQDSKANFKLGNFTDYHIQFPSCTYSYFNIFTNMYFDKASDIEWILKLINITKKRLIVGIYDDVSNDDITLKIKTLEDIVIARGFKKAKKLTGDRRKNYEAFYFDRK